MLALHSQALEMQEENRTLRERVKALEDARGFAKTLRFEPLLYFAPDDRVPFVLVAGKSIDGPFI